MSIDLREREKKRGWKQWINHQGENLKDDWFHPWCPHFKGLVEFLLGNQIWGLSATQKVIFSELFLLPSHVLGREHIPMSSDKYLDLGAIPHLSPYPKWWSDCWAWSNYITVPASCLILWSWENTFTWVTDDWQATSRASRVRKRKSKMRAWRNALSHYLGFKVRNRTTRVSSVNFRDPGR